MSESIEMRLAQAKSELERAEAALAKAQDELRGATVVSRSRDRAVEVTVGPQGELKGLRFLEEKYRTMQGTQLAASVLEAAGEARALMSRRVMETFQPLLSASPTLSELPGTQIDWADIFGEVDLTDALKPSGSDQLRDEINEEE
ncbi:YbaB/EbfC family nucleoid-associated protein [Streptomyces sp. NBC_01092]|uniref:YbaB/EbfC family nucleoid-associated protein n=1 Tax=Streptomyces sp. NBC_01092 TaxID=2903748 RepID=UPI003865DC51|nr:YbaB/EbfC family nucleoid-associated protein [Streptomyces sp. NBC_01092]